MGKAFSLICPETTLLIDEEIKLLLLSFLMGVIICIYICIKYSLIKALNLGRGFLFVSDIITSLVITVSVFLFLLKFNFGIIRLYLIVSMTAGAFFFKKFFYAGFQKLILFLLRPLEAAISLFVKFKRKYRKSES